MRARLVLIEGLPGCGKTSTARDLQRRLAARGVDAAWYLEEARDHPVTPRIPGAPRAGPARVSGWLAGWKRVVDALVSAERVEILEGCAFQSTARFLFAADVPGEEIADYVRRFEEVVAPARPRLVYLWHPDPSRHLRETVLPDRGPDWVERVSAYTASTPLARSSGWSGTTGTVEFWLAYRTLCDALVESLDMPVLRVDVSTGDWSAILDRVEGWLSPGASRGSRARSRPGSPPG